MNFIILDANNDPMIKFFRKIRQRLLTENKFSKYLIYAIGEIVLVVIGILIALSINNWNAEKKSLQRQNALLTQMKNNLEDNLVQFRSVEKAYQRRRESIKIVIDHIHNKEKLQDSISHNFYGPFRVGPPNISSSAFETLKSSGLDIIKSDKLREKIITHYQVLYEQYAKTIERGLDTWETEVIASYYSQNFSVSNDKFLTPNNYEFLFSDQKFMNILTSRRSFFRYIISELKRIQELTQALIIDLENHLEFE